MTTYNKNFTSNLEGLSSFLTNEKNFETLSEDELTKAIKAKVSALRQSAESYKPTTQLSKDKAKAKTTLVNSFKTRMVTVLGFSKSLKICRSILDPQIEKGKTKLNAVQLADQKAAKVYFNLAGNFSETQLTFALEKPSHLRLFLNKGQKSNLDATQEIAPEILIRAAITAATTTATNYSKLRNSIIAQKVAK